MSSFLYISLVWLLAGFLNGVTSFGGNLFAVPLMMLVMDAKEAIIFSCIVGTGVTVMIAVLYHGKLPLLEFVLASVSSAVGIPIGMVILNIASVKSILILSGVILLLFLIWQTLSARMHIVWRAPLWAILPAGLLAGILLSSTAMGGPALAMYAVLRGWSKEETISVLNTMAAVAMTFIVMVQWFDGMYTPKMLYDALWALPCAVIGVLLSIPVIGRINQRFFRVLLMSMLAFSMIMLFVKGFSD